MNVSSVLFASVNFFSLRCASASKMYRIGGGGRIGITSNYLFVFPRSVRARQSRRSGCRVPIGIKAITSECDRREQENDRGRDDRLLETLPKETGFQCDIARWRWRCGHKRRDLSVENRVRVVLCHAKLSRASRAKSGPPRDKLFSGDKILLMNAFWNSFETLLGLGVEPRNLTFVQISVRAIIVFLVTLATVRLRTQALTFRGKLRSTRSCWLILAAVLSRAINGSAAFFATLGRGRGFGASPSAVRFFSHSIPMGLAFSLKADPMSLSAMDKGRTDDVAQSHLNA